MSSLLSSRQYDASHYYAQSYEAFVPESDLYRIALAYRIASFVHRGKTRCDKKTPFFHHVLAVTDIRVNDIGLRWTPLNQRVDAIVSCLLHDAREECPDLVTEKFVTMVFGQAVNNILNLVTKTPGYKREVYYNSLMACLDPEPVTVKLCDNLHNSRTLGMCPENFQLRQIMETDLHYVPLANHLISLLPEDRKWIGYYLLESLEAVCRSYKREYGPHVFP
ncbi:hypothetical protein KKH39_03825 [Patescibacteria group bacterium]|nr:hypothetical protein [Patescibacteria group bacterium]